MEELFLRHPRAAGESYRAHQRAAMGFAKDLFKAAVACALHSLVPAVFQTTGSAAVARLHREMSARNAHASE